MSEISYDEYEMVCSDLQRAEGEYEALLKHFEILKASCGGKDTEIERLKEENWHYSEVQAQLKWVKNTNGELLTDLARKRELLTRAADALDHVLPIETYAFLDWRPYYELKKELRDEAAKL